jgi:hypothetical protein
MLWYLMLHEELRCWEQRVGAWVARCQTCHQDVWQLTFRVYRTKGTGMNPPTPFSYPIYGECYQVRCSGCGVAAMVGHPNQWAPAIGPSYVVEQQYPPMAANARYMQQAFAFFR